MLRQRRLGRPGLVALLVLVYPLAFLVPPRAPTRATLAAGVAAGAPLTAWAQDAGDDFGSATIVVEVLFAAVKAVQGPTCEVSHILLEDEKSAAEVFAQFVFVLLIIAIDGHGPEPAVAFDKNSPLGTALGPVETEFGYHILWIRNRDGV
ncbi:hypothetical protein AK812_SmicGene35682 [Symbiodinium microadriaticum]|uniref:Peptidylprolyl isomerase n=1 Tax=Symbiodinium microadriaticum TaxID=2951 RepID=A0A1Q9CKU4_SYMMI|nr:hypothetical protein AK812_SmicGene35682 [Symbiodinium microadriaticum]